MENILIFGIGNLVQCDDGFGVHVIRELTKIEKSLPPNVKLIDAGTSIVDFMSDLSQADRVICVDVADGGQPPGTIYRFKSDDVGYKQSKFHHAHKIDIFQTLEMIRYLDKKAPETIIVAVQPENIDWGTELSDTVRNQLPKVLQVIEEEIKKIETVTK